MKSMKFHPCSFFFSWIKLYCYIYTFHFIRFGLIRRARGFSDVFACFKKSCCCLQPWINHSSSYCSFYSSKNSHIFSLILTQMHTFINIKSLEYLAQTLLQTTAIFFLWKLSTLIVKNLAWRNNILYCRYKQL